MLERESLLDRVTFTGRVSDQDKIAALKAADIFVLPSYSEAFGIAMLEAMACGLPVVLTDRAALAGQMAEGGAALVVKSDVQALAAGISRLLNDADLSQRLGQAGRAMVSSQFSWPAIADRFLDLYETARQSPLGDRSRASA
jgi:glycosyltransferase involved in cell wall biosynthesis